MKILAIERENPDARPNDFQHHLKDEASHLWDLYQKSIVREAYFHAEQHTAVLVLECKSVDEARRILDTLPLVQASLIDFDLLPLVPYDGFARLFGRP